MADNQRKGDFKVLSSMVPLKLDNNTFYVSVQKITQDDGSSSDHLVIKKISTNEDGSPRGQPRQIFIPVDVAERVLKSSIDLLSKRR